MSEWSTIKLGDVLEITNGYAFKSVNFRSEPETNCLPVLKIKNVANGDVHINDVQYHLFEEKLSKYTAQKGDILISLTGNHPHAETQVVGAVSKLKMDIRAFVNQRVAKIDTKPNLADKDYIYFALKEEGLSKYLASQSSGSANQANISKADIEDLDIALPPLPEQKAIATVLSSLDDKIDLLHRQNKTLEAMAETLFRQWVIEEASEDWEEVPLSDYFKVKHGYAFKGEFITPEPTKYRLVTPGNFEMGGGFKFAKFKYYSSDVIPEDYIFNELDFVVTMTDLSKEGDTLGYPAFVPLHHKTEVLYLHNQRVGKVQFYSEEECKFFFYMLMKQDVYQQFIVGSCTGTSVKHTSPTTIGSFTFASPPKERMQEFDRIVRQKFAKIFANTKQIQTLEQLRDTLLPKLMSDEVRVHYQTEQIA